MTIFVVKNHPKLEKKLLRLPELKREQEDAEKVMQKFRSKYIRLSQSLPK
ncbi:hypothetical protein [Paenibacillus thalictri]|nr:hypothetical protein [Paenibacillus thalictri]